MLDDILPSFGQSSVYVGARSAATERSGSLKRDDQARFGGVASVLTRNGGQWTPDKKLIGTGAVGKSAPAVALSADGSIVMIGGSNDNGGVGATWVFMRSGGGSDYQEPPRPSAPSNPAVNLEE